jgi:hypothetical protein
VIRGLRLEMNLRPVEPQTNARQARGFAVGKITNSATGETNLFNNAGELLTILGKENAMAPFSSQLRRRESLAGLRPSDRRRR